MRGGGNFGLVIGTILKRVSNAMMENLDVTLLDTDTQLKILFVFQEKSDGLILRISSEHGSPDCNIVALW